jgi:hypothetical protein
MSHPAAVIGAIHDGGRGQLPAPRTQQMNTRRMAYWWFRFVVSGRFLEKFLKQRRA